MKVFLGGTCNESKWREKLIPMLEIDYFNPVVDDWNDEAFQNELIEKEEADLLLFVITPKMTGVFSIAEVVEASNKVPKKTIFCVLEEDDGLKFDKGQMMSLEKVGYLIEVNGGKVFKDLEAVGNYLNEPF